jgi:DNA-binding IclR family transcriptional regulator
MSGNERSNRPVTTTETSIRILERLKANGRTSLAGLADELEMARSTIHRHLLTLENNDLIGREDGEYHLGLRFLDLGMRARDRIEFYHAARPLVDRLAAETDEKVWLVAKDGRFSVHLYKSYGDNPLETSARVGQRRYLHQLAAGKAILSELPNEEIRDVLDHCGLPEQTEHTITERDELLGELDGISDRGYAFNRGESITGLNAVGAPIRDTEGHPVGAISISGPANRVKGDLLREELPDKLLAAIDEIHIHLRYASDGEDGRSR